MQGFLLGLLPAAVLSGHGNNPHLPGDLGVMAGILSAIMMLAGTGLLFKYKKSGQSILSAGVLFNLYLLYFELLQSPLLSLFVLTQAMALLYYLFTARLRIAPVITAELHLDRIIGCASAGILLALASPIFAASMDLFPLSCTISMAILVILSGMYCRKKQYFNRKKLTLTILATTCVAVLLMHCLGAGTLTIFLAAPVILFTALKLRHADLGFLRMIINHPARCLGITFLGLCISGTLLLKVPCARTGDLSTLEAAFTSVSAICVTGLTVIDISTELTTTGQLFLMLLIQLGGLGIMTLTTLALHAIGKLSLTGEQLITELTPNDDTDVFDTLRLILKYTFTVEFIGALLLTWRFHGHYGDWLMALKQGFFTSVSAFCNAGFFPGSQSLVPFAGEKFLITVVALEIVLGGMAPTVMWSFLNMRRNRRIPYISKLVLESTCILLFGGMFLLLLFEWNGIFNGLPLADKLVNGFFQSATLRTAGFNTVSFSALGVPAYIVMVLLMFIGGSPGGTAGGIKTTTLAVLALAFRSAVKNEDAVIAGNRRLEWRNIVQAIAVFMSAALVLLTTIMMLVTTQTIGVEKLVFEAVSALATVGLSLDCTTELDSVGRMIIMGAMFIGRIGPMTLFCLLSETRSSGQYGYPQIKIPLG